MKRLTFKLATLALLALAGAAQGQINDPRGGGANLNVTAGYLAPSLTQGAQNFRNLLDNGAFNIYQRGVTAASGISTTATYHADRWAGYGGASSSVTLTNITSGLPFGFGNAEQLQRAAANAILLPIFLVQEIPTTDVISLQGQPVCVSASLVAGATYSAASSKVTVQVITGTGTDQGLASLIAATWTGQATTLNDSSQTISTTWNRYTPNAWCFTMPSNATEAAVQFGFTPVGTAGATDLIQVTGAQFEQVGTQLPPAGSTGLAASVFEQRSITVELPKVQRYFWQFNEANTWLLGTGQCNATNTINLAIATPVQMRVAPTAAITAGGFQVNIAGAGAAGISGQTMGTNTVNQLVLNATNACTAGNTVTLRGTGTTGKITATADF